MLPVDLFGSLYGVSGQRVIQGNPGHVFPAQVCDHVVDCAEFLFQVT